MQLATDLTTGYRVTDLRRGISYGVEFRNFEALTRVASLILEGSSAISDQSEHDYFTHDLVETFKTSDYGYWIDRRLGVEIDMTPIPAAAIGPEGYGLLSDSKLVAAA